jgi:hypothetical protein
MDVLIVLLFFLLVTYFFFRTFVGGLMRGDIPEKWRRKIEEEKDTLEWAKQERRERIKRMRKGGR